MSSAFSGVTASGTFYIISLGFLLFWIFMSSWSPHLSRIWDFRSSISSLLSASIRTLPFLRLLNALIPIFIFTGPIFDFSSFLISSDDWFSFGFTVSLCRSSLLPHTISENSFFLSPLDGAGTALPRLISAGLLLTDGATV